jgi:raffinose/stachyose/melibiose transport system permease protein
MGINFLILVGLMLPPAILPTIWVMQVIRIYRSLFGMILVEVALNIPFTTMLYRGYTASVPREIEEAAYLDGCDSIRSFVQVIFPLLMPVTATVIVLSSVNIFNDFVNPLYFLPGSQNHTVQLTLYNFMGRYASSWNMLFADVVLITIPPLLLFIFFNKKILSGITAGAIKG